MPLEGQPIREQPGMNDPVDILIVGAGAAGGVLCKELAEAGFKVVVLEAGPHWVPERDFVSDEKGAEQLYWTDPRVNRGWCIYGCSTNAKSSTLVTYIPKAIKAGAEIRANCMATRVNLGPDGLAQSVTYIRTMEDGQQIEEQQDAQL